jgi:competence protein ComEA
MKTLTRIWIMLKKLALVLFLSFFSFSAFSADKININTATVEQLQTLKGIGAKTAMAIIEYRENIGAFNNVEELIEVKGIGEKKLALISQDVIIENKEVDKPM